MNYIVIDTSGKNLTVVINKNGQIFKYFDAECGTSHSVALMPVIEDLAKKADFDFNDADFMGAVVGAGSFTGIRIGVATIKAMCFAYKKPCLSITSFDTLAYNENGGKVLALIDAKHNGFYVCGYNDKKVDFPPEYLTRDKVEEIAKDYKILASAPIEGFDVTTVSVLDGLIRAVEEKTEQITFDLESLVPLYVRKSQAEEGR